MAFPQDIHQALTVFVSRKFCMRIQLFHAEVIGLLTVASRAVRASVIDGVYE
jgi:hypothetical protein